MTFEEWWASLTEKEQRVIGINNAKFVWQKACEACAEKIKKTEKDAMPLFDDWDKKW